MSDGKNADTNEILYRQVGPGGNPVFFNPDKSPPLNLQLFLPTKVDTDGLSLIDARFRSQVWAAFRPEKPGVRFHLAVLSVGNITKLGSDVGLGDFKLRSTPDSLDKEHGEPHAHCVATAINRKDYEADPTVKMMIKQWARDLTESIPLESILGPFDPPTEQDSYRP